MAHITGPFIPGEKIEVSFDGKMWHERFVLCTNKTGCVYEDEYGYVGQLAALNFSRCPPQRNTVPWNAETFAPFWNHQFKKKSSADSNYIRITGTNRYGVWSVEENLSWEALQADWLHRPSPSSPPPGCRVKARWWSEQPM